MSETQGNHCGSTQWIYIYDVKRACTWVKSELWFQSRLGMTKIVLNGSCRKVFKATASHKGYVFYRDVKEF